MPTETRPAPTRLLVSVRSAAEAEAALEGGADLIDVKEPARGSLGRADDAVIKAVASRLAGRRDVSIAAGELMVNAAVPALPGIRYVKWGLAGWHDRPAWRAILGRLLSGARPGLPQVVVVAYADWSEAAAPSVEEVAGFVAGHPGSSLLVDTFHKGLGAGGRPARTLLDWIPLPELGKRCAACRQAGVRIALAGSLGPDQVADVLQARPDWVGVRGAACRGGRTGTISADRVRSLAHLLAAPTRGTRPAG